MSLEKTLKMVKAKQVCFSIILAVVGFVILIPALSQAAETTCAKVNISITQEATLERQAFDAHMRINNGLTNISLQDINVDVKFEDEGGNTVLASSDPDNTSALFFIRVDTMDNISNVTGSGAVAPATSADIHWLIIPAPGASNGIPSGTMYYVGATLTYTVGGVESSVEVVPDYIFVKPMPELTLDYFLPAEVFGDDAFTAEIEPPVPFSLGVRAQNNGSGVARKFKIDSAQPKIVENEQGLLINFMIQGSEVNGQPATPSLLADFGDIDSNAAGTARWIMTCSLSGRFVEFKASFSHADELGGELTSLLEATNTHFLVQDVLVDLPGRDNIKDFLAMEVATGGPLTVYESDNLETSVPDLSAFSSIQFVSAGNGAGEVIHTMTTPVTGGFMYVKLQDPYNGSKAIREIIRSDGKIIKRENGWLSRTRPAGTSDWLYNINLFDVDTTDGYTVVFADYVADPDLPTLQAIPDRTGVEGELLSFIVEASVPSGAVPSLSASPMPPLGVFTDNGDGTATFAWTPVEGQAGTYEVAYTATNGSRETSQTATITIYSMHDRDGDGILNTIEEAGCTDPNNPDSDGDGISDGVEDANLNGIVDAGETDPCKADTDGDGISDSDEINIYGTDPLNPDTDGDGFSDGEELAAGTDPLDETDSPNKPPVADAGNGRMVMTGSTVALDGSNSSDPEDDALTYQWTFTQVPAGSVITDADLSDPTTEKPTFIPDADGDYALEMTVDDSYHVDSASVTMQAITTPVGSIWGWGDNAFGQLADITYTNGSVPMVIDGLAEVIAVSGGSRHTLALTADRTVYAFGSNGKGQLGDGTFINSSTPVQVLDLVDVLDIASGADHNLALDKTGTVLTWGANTSGQLGDGSHVDSSIPWPVADLFSIEAIAAGDSHSLALRSDGTVWAWGANGSGQLGDGTFAESAVVVQVAGLNDIIAIAAGANHSMALMLDGTVWTWGENGAGQLGDGSLVGSNTPVQITGLANVIAIAAGAEHSMALKADKTVLTWGANANGQLGDGTTADSAIPNLVSGLADVKTIAAGTSHSMALSTDNMVWTWGGNSLGQLGDSTDIGSTEPVQITGFTDVASIEAGTNHSMVLTGSISFINAKAGMGGSIAPAGETPVYDGDDLTLAITPDVGFKVDGILVDDGSMAVAGTYTFSTVGADHTIAVIFSLLETDTDHDFIPDAEDNCPLNVNPYQIDSDGDNAGDVCDSDDDNDGVADLADNCPLVYNSDQANADNDSLGDACEQGPAGDDPLYDGNRDGIPDFEQANVESLPTYDDTGYVTFALNNGTTGVTLDYVTGVDNPSPSDAPVSSKFPLGFFDFQLSGMAIGGETTMGLYLPDNVLAVNGYYKYGPTPENLAPHWYQFLYDGQTGAEIVGNAINLHFIDGKRGDDDLSENGVIVDVGGPDLSINYVPDISHISITLQPVIVNSDIPVSADFTDVETGETHTAQWDWGDSSVSNGTVVESTGMGIVSGSHLYTTPGVYTITLSVTDSFGNTGIKKHCYLVVYDPEGGFVTGGGWIYSPSGAFTADPNLEGKANFGFVSKYKKGESIPSGVTEFQFKVARFNFHSEVYEWLVVAGDKAKFKGHGTINGEGLYGFMLSAVDGDQKGNPDTFRIKIWDLATEHIVYDNVLGDADDIDPTFEIGGGNIKVHNQ